MVLVRTRQPNGKECRKVLIVILLKRSTSLAKHENLLSLHQVAHLFLSSLLIDSLLVKTILSFNAAKFLCGKHGKLEAFLGHCFGVS